MEQSTFGSSLDMSFERTEVDVVFLVAPTSGASVLSVAGAGSVGSIGAAGADGERVLSLIGPMVKKTNQHQMARLAGLPCQVTPVFFWFVCVFLVLRASLVLRFICWIFGWPFKLFWSIIWEVWKLPESKWNQIHPRVVANILNPQIGGFLIVENFHFGSIFSGEPAVAVCGWGIDSRHRAFATVPGWHGPWAIKHVGSVQRFSVKRRPKRDVSTEAPQQINQKHLISHLNKRCCYCLDNMLFCVGAIFFCLTSLPFM